MATDLSVILEDRPGELARLGEAMGLGGVNIEVAYTTFGGVKLVIVTDDLEAARAVL